VHYLTLTLEGDHYAMGQQHGHLVQELRPQISRAIEARFLQLDRDGPDARFETLLKETHELLREACAPLLSLIRGQADALELSYDTLLRYDLITYLRDALLVRQTLESEGCTTWAASGPATVNGEPILVKNRDYRREHLALQVVVQAKPNSGYRYGYSSSAGSPGVFSAGMNETGLAVADTHVYSTDLGPGLPSYALMMEILEKHDSVSSAVDYLRSVPRLGRNNLILADAQGHLSVFEGGYRQHGLFRASGGTLVNTNHFVSDPMRACFAKVDPPEVRRSSQRRYETVSRELDASFGQIDVPFAQRLAAFHDGPLGSICRHLERDGKTGTISASIFLPRQRTLLFCHGLPCQGHYDEFRIGGQGLDS
jgi:isopenicillin-N N-acyltransferase-like protein